jgi:hypothetical protein
MDIATLKDSLLNAPWRKHSAITVEGRDGKVELVIRRPPDAEVLKLMQGAEKDGLVGGKGQDTSTESALRFKARVVALTVFLPNAVCPLFTEDEALSWPGMHDVSEACMAAILPPATNVERAKGN